MPVRKKLVIVGDEKCGKTSLLMRFAKDDLTKDLTSTDPQIFKADTEVDGKQVKMELYDTTWQEDHNQIRPYTYMNANIILIIFSLIDNKSLERAVNKWIPEVKHFSPNVPIILVGNKTDLRIDQETRKELATKNREPIRYEDGMMVAKNHGAYAYMECSATTNEGVIQVFEKAVQAALQQNKKKTEYGTQKCCLL